MPGTELVFCVFSQVFPNDSAGLRADNEDPQTKSGTITIVNSEPALKKSLFTSQPPIRDSICPQRYFPVEGIKQYTKQ